jgi:hypothetical protein
MSKKKKHEYSLLWTHFGPYGDQDVHLHPCVSHVDDESHECSLVYTGDGRDCAGINDGTHHKVDLDKKLRNAP